MLRFDLRLLPEEGHEKERAIIAESNAAAEKGLNHLKKLIGHKKCRKHPSSPNKVRVFAVNGKDPHAELVFYCCPLFVEQINNFR